MAEAFVHIGPIRGRHLVRRFYEQCGLEIIGPARVATGGSRDFDTLEDLLDHMKLRSEPYQVVVCHGNPQDGLLVQFTPEALPRNNATGRVIRDLGDCATKIRLGLAPQQTVVADLVHQIGVREDVVMRLLGKLAAMSPKFLELRGCKLGTDDAVFGYPWQLHLYAVAFHAVGASAPDCRMFYVDVAPHRPSGHQTVASLAGLQPSSKGEKGARRRLFQAPNEPPLAQAGPLLLDIHDIDGHTRVDSEAFMDAPEKVLSWAQAIDGAWSGGEPGFVTQVLWVDEHESGYHTPWDVSFRSHIKRV